MEKKHIYAIDTIIIVGSLLALISIIGYINPLVTAPADNLITTNNSVLFSFENANAIFIDDNIAFTSPEKIPVRDNLVINLKPGTYYWKVEGILESEIRKLTILSEVDLKLKKLEGDLYEVVNSGNIMLDVEIYDNKTLIDNIILDIDKSKNVSGTKFIGGEHENE